MKLYITVKSSAKRKGYITEQEFLVRDTAKTLKDLLCELSDQIVDAYLAKEIDADIVSILTDTQINEEKFSGKIGFQRRYGNGSISKKKAEETMLLAFEDGLFRAFLNDIEKTDIHADIELKDGDKLTLVRMIMLAGSAFPYLM